MTERRGIEADTGLLEAYETVNIPYDQLIARVFDAAGRIGAHPSEVNIRITCEREPYGDGIDAAITVWRYETDDERADREERERLHAERAQQSAAAARERRDRAEYERLKRLFEGETD